MKLFKKVNHKASVTESIDAWNYAKRVRTIGKRTFVTLYQILDVANGYKVIKSGFETRAEAVSFTETLTERWYLNAYEIEI